MNESSTYWLIYYHTIDESTDYKNMAAVYNASLLRSISRSISMSGEARHEIFSQ